MKLVQVGLATASVLVLFGCVSEQERREAQIAQTMVADIRSSIAAKDYDKAERLCDEGVTKCPTVDYDWASVKSNIAQLRQAIGQKEYAEWKRSDDGQASVSLEVFESKFKAGWRDRAKKKSMVRREQAMRIALYEKTVTNDLATIKKCYSRGYKYENPFLGERRRERNERSDWLAKWASPRLELAETDALAGEALLSDFGTKYLPNAYANYEKKREAVAELQQVFNEEFPQPWTIKSTDSKWNSFNKVLEKFVKTRTEFFICHDELCHYWLLSRFGVLRDNDFVQIDAKPLTVHLLPENIERAGYTLMKMIPMENKIAEFAAKYAPESNAIYQKMEREFKEIDALLSEVCKQRIQMDDVRYSRVLAVAISKRNDLVREMNALSYQLQAWHMDHRTTEKSSEDVAKCDAAMGRQLKPFVDALPSYIKEHTLGSVIARNDFINLNGGTLYHTDNRGKEYSTNIASFRMQRFEVTQLQWMLVMGDNPSERKGADLPVENVSWDDCQKFIKKLNEAEGTDYRLPTVNEWEFACRAGSRGTWCKGRNGEEIKDESVDRIGWFGYFDGGSSRTCKYIHPIGLKEPNLWGLYDMLGNACEWCVGEDPRLVNYERSERKFYHSYRGGSAYDGSGYFKYCDVSEGGIGRGPRINLGFRLAASSN